MSSATFLSIPKTIFVTVTTEIMREKQPMIEYHLPALEADEHGITFALHRYLPPLRPFRFILRPSDTETPSGTLTRSRPDLTFELDVSPIAPARLHLHREILENDQYYVTALVPLRNVAPSTLKINGVPEGITIPKQQVNDIDSMRRAALASVPADVDNETHDLHYFGELMVNFHVLELNYDPYAPDCPEIFPDIQALLRDYTSED